MSAYAHGTTLRKHGLRIAPPENFAEQVNAVSLADVPNLKLDRHAPRKDQARAARDLFKRLGIRGVSFTCPVYSMAFHVNVRLPEDDWAGPHDLDMEPHDCRPEVKGERCGACGRKNATRAKVQAILDAAFPNHLDRSDYQTDYFDSRWMMD